jgi:hypothetical protein
MEKDDHNQDKSDNKKFIKNVKIWSVLITVSYLLIGFGFGNLMLLLFGLYTLHHFWLKKVIHNFQHKQWPKVQNAYTRLVTTTLNGKRSISLIIGTIVLLVLMELVNTPIPLWYKRIYMTLRFLLPVQPYAPDRVC